MRVIFEQGNHRIVEQFDCDYDIEDLKGDCYDAEVNDDIDPTELARQEQEFENLVSNEGVYGYILEVWNPEIEIGWEHVDSCWGFVGQYTPSEETFNHYIVEELKQQIAS